MAKSAQRIKARKLRTRGKSVKEIAFDLDVSKSTVSLWTRDIALSVTQKKLLKNKQLAGAAKGRAIGALKQHQARLELMTLSLEAGKAWFNNLSRREHFAAGLALYWAEGIKKQRKVSLCNSDPQLINFFISWLKLHLGVTNDRLVACVGINQLHKRRELLVREYWSQQTGIPLVQFRKTSYKKVVNAKVYENKNKHFGTLTVYVLRPAQLYYKILGLIAGLASARVAQLVRASDS